MSEHTKDSDGFSRTLSVARQYAATAYLGIHSPLTGKPSIEEATESVFSLNSLFRSFGYKQAPLTMQVAALLSRAPLVTPSSLDEISERFGMPVAELVFWLTDMRGSGGESRVAWQLTEDVFCEFGPVSAHVLLICDTLSQVSTLAASGHAARASDVAFALPDALKKEPVPREWIERCVNSYAFDDDLALAERFAA